MSRKHWMVILAGILLFVGAAVLMAGPGQNHQVGTNSVMILPPRGIQNAAAWATNTLYAQGDVVAHGGMFFWCQTASGGTNTVLDAPAYEDDGRSADGTNTWQFIPSGPRAVAVIVNDGTNVIYSTIRPAAALNSGVRLNASGGVWNIQPEILQGSFYAICGSAANSVTTFDQ